ncbi:MAG: hypothetical protein RBR43_00940 [Desulfuromonadaceae bacterium]|nr:hypothetical protein [Desulfuromonas sp.]MDY0184428.1 hypothetical protein [Desulfuromonadaceae bacterium]
MEQRILIVARIVILALLCSIVGCAKSGEYVYTAAPQLQARLCRVALLPLLNETENSTASTLCYRTMVTELMAAPQIQVCNPADMKNVLRRRQIYPSEIYSAPASILEGMAEELEVDGYIRGKVLTFTQEYADGKTKVPHIALQLELLKADGSLISQVFYTRGGDDYRSLMHYGVVYSYTELAARMTRELIAKWIQQGQIGCNS